MGRLPEHLELPADERRALVEMLVANEVLVAVAGIVLAAASSFARSFDIGAVVLGGWIADIAAQLVPEPALVAAVVAVAGVLTLLMAAAEPLLYPRIESYRRAVDENRQGISGELVRLPLPAIAGFMLVVGVVEELLFRYGAYGLLLVLLGAVLPHAAAVVAALAVSTLLFTVVHVQYRNPWNIATVFVAGLVLGIAYILTGSLLSVMLAHAVYDIVGLFGERYRMVRDEDYFRGKMPVSIVCDMKRGGAVAS